MSKRKHDETEKLSKTDKDELIDRDKADKSKRSKNLTRENSDKPAGASLKADKKSTGESKSKRDAERDDKKDKAKRSDTNDEDAGNSATASGGEVSLSIEETNKLRAKLGLKPLQVDSGPSKSTTKSEASGGSGKTNKVADRMVTNEVLVRAENAADKHRTENIKLKLDTRKEARKIERRLARIKTLGESSEEDSDDISNWVVRQRTMDDERKLAEQRAKMFEDMDNELASQEDRAPMPPAVRRKEQPSASGLKVDHAFDQIEPGMQVTLTLKDAPVLAGTSKRGRDDYDTALLASGPQDGDEDVLVSVDLLERERGERSRTSQAQLAAWKRGLASLDDDANQASLLAKYDAPKTASFRIGQLPEPDTLAANSNALALALPVRRFDDGPKISIELPELRIARDFLNEDEMAARFKKRRATKSTKTNLRRHDAASSSDKGATRQETVAIQPVNIEVDEEVAIRGELETLLERTRQAKLREFKAKEESVAPDLSMASALRRLRPITEFINLQPSNLNENDEADQQEQQEESTEETGAAGLDFNATFEFCKKVAAKQEELARRRALLEKEAGNTLPRVDDDEMQIASDDEQRDVKLQPAQDSYMDLDVKPKQQSTTTKLKVPKRESEQEDKDNKHKVPKRESEHDDAAADSDSSNDDQKGNKTAVLEEEPVLNSGVCAAIQVAFKKGYLDSRTEQKVEGSRLTNLQAKQFQVEQKRYDDIDAKFAKRDRFVSSAIQTFREKEGYNPNVKLQYVDESGKKLDAKAEFQRLSWRFHGKTSGKNKLEKRAALEKRAHALKVMDASDTPLGTAEKLRRKLENEHQPFLVLSGAASASSSKT